MLYPKCTMAKNACMALCSWFWVGVVFWMVFWGYSTYICVVLNQPTAKKIYKRIDRKELEE